MNRRDFLKLAAAAVASRAAPSLPPIVSQEPTGEWVTIDAIRRAADTLRANAGPGPYTIFMHSETALDLLESLSPKERWRMAYRQARLDIRELGDRLTESLHANGIGRVESVRFIKEFIT